MKLQHTLLKLMAMALIVMTGAFAQAKQQNVSCSAPQNQYANFVLRLDDSGFTPGSGLSLITLTNWAYMYSSARLICSQDYLPLARSQAAEISCIGYLTGEGSRIELKGSLTDGAGKMVVHNLDTNVYASETEGLELNCTLN